MYCSECRDKKGKGKSLKVPFIKNIHQSVYEATKKENALNMRYWHMCKTTHCRAGCVVHLAGDEGKKLEEKIGTLLAANLIYKKSSDIPVHWALRFFEDNETAMKDIVSCAKLEKNNAE